MRSEAEIRLHIAAVKKLHDYPCNCASTGHAESCYIAGKFMEHGMNQLLWALGESTPEFNDKVQKTIFKAQELG